MAAVTREDMQNLAAAIGDLRRDIDIRFARVDAQFGIVDAKLDAKPSLAALYQAVATLAFGIGAVIASTVVVLKAVGVIH